MEQIRAVAAQVAGVRGVEKCYARKTGMRYHVDLHLEVDPEMTVRQSHEIAHQVRQRIVDDWIGWRMCWCTWSRRRKPSPWEPAAREQVQCAALMAKSQICASSFPVVYSITAYSPGSSFCLGQILYSP